MDALATAILVMVFGSYYMWWRLKQRHAFGVAVLLAGLLTCGWFISGLF